MHGTISAVSDVVTCPAPARYHQVADLIAGGDKSESLGRREAAIHQGFFEWRQFPDKVLEVASQRAPRHVPVRHLHVHVPVALIADPFDGFPLPGPNVTRLLPQVYGLL